MIKLKSKKDEDKIDECIKSMELERNIINTVKNSSTDNLTDGLSKLGFLEVFELGDKKWFIYQDEKYILVLSNDSLHLYEKEIELYFNEE